MNAEDRHKWLLGCCPHLFASLKVHGEDIHASLSSGKKMTSFFKILHDEKDQKVMHKHMAPGRKQGSKSMSITLLCSYCHKLLLCYQRLTSLMPAAPPPYWAAGLPALSLHTLVCPPGLLDLPCPSDAAQSPTGPSGWNGISTPLPGISCPMASSPRSLTSQSDRLPVASPGRLSGFFPSSFSDWQLLEGKAGRWLREGLGSG